MPKKVILLSNFKLHEKSSASFARMENYRKSLLLRNTELVFTSIQEFECGTPDIEYTDVVKSAFNKFYSLFLKEFDFVSAVRYYRRIRYLTNDNVFLLYPFSFASSLVFLLVKIFLRKRIFIEKNELQFAIKLNHEFPTGIINKIIFLNSLLILLPLNIFEDFLHGFFSGMITISSKMNKLYRPFNKRIVTIPILVDMANYEIENDQSSLSKLRICFTGSVSDRKDKIYDVICAIKNENVLEANVCFNIYGSANHSTKLKIKQLLGSLGSTKSILYNGKVDSKAIPGILASSDVLLLLRASNLQNEYGFSTKLAEYLASGTAVLTTDVSDNGKYLIDGENAFIIPKEQLSVDTISRKIKYLLQNREYLISVGRKGKQLAFERFNYLNYSDSLNKFLG